MHYGDENQKLVGWQIVNQATDMNPDNMTSWEIYTQDYVLHWMADLPLSEKPNWRLLPIFEGDVEEPTFVED